MSRGLNLRASIKAAVVGIGVFVAATTWGAGAMSSRAITVFGQASDPNGDTLFVSATADERLANNDSVAINGGTFLCFGQGAALAGLFNFKINPTVSAVSLTVDTTNLTCFPDPTPPMTVAMSCSSNGLFYDNSEGNGSSNFSGPGAATKYHVVRRGVSTDCTGSIDSQSFDVPGVGFLYYMQYASH